MSDRLRIYNRKGVLLSEFTAAVTRSWVIGDKATASFDVSVFESYCNGDVLRFGNWLLVENDKLPKWVGTIGSRSWGTRSVTVAAFTPEFLISQRIGEIEKKINASAGDIFAEIIGQVNASEITILETGDIYKSEPRQETINATALSQDLSRIRTRSNEDYAWRAVEVNGRLKVYGDWSKKLGLETQFSLHEGVGGGNIEATGRILVEDMPEGNSILGYGNGATWTTKPLGRAIDSASIADYGLIQKSISYNGVSTPAALEKNASDELKKKKNPAAVYSVVALDVGDTFQYSRLGNVVYLRMQNIGFTGSQLGTSKRVRIIGMVYTQMQNKLELALEEIT